MFFPMWLWAEDYQPKNTAELQLPDKVQGIEQPSVREKFSTPAAKAKAVEVDKKTLLANPALLKRAMYSVLLTQQIDGIRVILPIYRQLADADSLLITYAEALLAHYQGQLTRAINGYRQVIAKEPKMSVARLNLAMALYVNRQSMAARDQLTRLQSEQLPKPVAETVKQIIARIDREEDWQFDVNFYYRQENNINNAPEQSKMDYQGGQLTFQPPEKAHGLHLAFGAKKRFNLNDNLYTNLQLNADSDFFWDNHPYDDLSLRTGVGFGYQTAKFNAEIQPFIKKRFYGTQPYSLTAGAGGHFSYQLSPRWKLSNHWEWSYETFNQRKFLNGQRHFIGLSALYIPSPQQYWSAGINYYNSQAKYQEDQFYRTGMFIGWGQEWPKGLSSNLTLSAGRRHYDGVDFFNIKRADKEYTARLSLWHRGIHYLGITPRLVWSYNKTDSNHFYYKKQENTVNLEFSKAF